MKKILALILMVILIIGTFGCTSESLNFYKDKEVFEENLDKPIEATPAPPAPLEPKYSQAKILAVGDIMFHMPQVNSSRTDNKSYDFYPPFKYVKKYIEDADIAMANFETVTAGNELGFSGFPRFNSPVETIKGLEDAGFDILSTINNHSLDMDKIGIINTIDTINVHGLENIGTYKDESRPILLKDINGIKVGFIAYTSSLNALDSLLTEEESFMVNKLDESLIEMDINYLKSQNVDIIVAYLHWGYEYYKEPTSSQLELGRRILELGVDIIFGSHPHVIQSSEIIEIDGEKKLIVYSMGNFLSNQRYETMGNSYTEDGVMVEIILEKNNLDNNTIIKEVGYIPTWVYRYRHNGRLHYEILSVEEVLLNKEQYSLNESTLKRIERSKNDTINAIYDKINKE